MTRRRRTFTEFRRILWWWTGADAIYLAVALWLSLAKVITPKQPIFWVLLVGAICSIFVTNALATSHSTRVHQEIREQRLERLIAARRMPPRHLEREGWEDV